jgi:anti-sigma factor RsiW
MTIDSRTRQRLLELIYDLLPETEAAELRGQIDADEQLARAYAEAQATAKLHSNLRRRP